MSCRLHSTSLASPESGDSFANSCLAASLRVLHKSSKDQEFHVWEGPSAFKPCYTLPVIADPMFRQRFRIVIASKR